MLNFGRLLSYPLTFKNLTEKIKQTKLDDINIYENELGMIVSAKSNNHNIKMQFFSKSLSINSKVQVYCDCEFFKFNLAYTLFKNDGLLHPELFKLVQPKTKNVYLTLSGCKHIILVSQTLWKNNKFVIL